MIQAAHFSHRRFIGAGLTWSRPMRLTDKDKYYICLPMYHGNGGVVALSAVWKVGCTAVIRDKFSVSNFWKVRFKLLSVHRCYCYGEGNVLIRLLHVALTVGSLQDIARFGCTAMVYIGELWRYLHNQVLAPFKSVLSSSQLISFIVLICFAWLHQPTCPEEHKNTLRVIAGNGLRSDIWHSITHRFGMHRVSSSVWLVQPCDLTETCCDPF